MIIRTAIANVRLLRRGRIFVLSLVPISLVLISALATNCTGSGTNQDVAAPTSGVTITNLDDIRIDGSAPNHDGNLRWSLVEPLTREVVGLDPIAETDTDTYVYSWRRPELINVELELPDGELFVQQAQDVTGNLSRLEAGVQDLTVRTDGFTLVEAEQELIGYAERFKLDTDQISAWRTESADFIADEDFGRNRLNLAGTDLGYLHVSVVAVANAASDDAAIYWYFDWG